MLDANGSVAVITILSSGTDYQGTPGVEISPPAEANGSAEQVSPAFAEADFNASSLTLEGVNVVSSGRGYIEPPEISIEEVPASSVSPIQPPLILVLSSKSFPILMIRWN